MKIAYLGPAGTFTEQAALYYDSHSDREACGTIDDVLQSVLDGESDIGIVPIENSTDGAVNATVDSLIYNKPLFIQRQLNLPISHCLMVNKENTGRHITKILSKAEAIAQCRAFLRENYHDAVTEPVSSTAEAARIVAASGGTVAAIGTELAASIYGLEIIADNIQDQTNNVTYFAAVSKNDSSAPVSGCKTTLAFSTRNSPGELYRVLDIFSLWDINMTKILSRPMRSSPGEYVFLVDIEGYDADDAVDALTMIKRKTSFFKVLGTYPVIFCNAPRSLV